MGMRLPKNESYVKAFAQLLERNEKTVLSLWSTTDVIIPHVMDTLLRQQIQHGLLTSLQELRKPFHIAISLSFSMSYSTSVASCNNKNWPMASPKLCDAIGQLLLLQEATDVECDMEKESDMKRFAQLLERNEKTALDLLAQQRIHDVRSDDISDWPQTRST